MHRLGVVIVAVLAVQLVLVAPAVATWVRAWRHAADAPGCVGCGLARVDVMAYPAGAGALPYCRLCVDGWPLGEQLPPMVGLRRPVDPVRLIEPAVGMCITVALAAAYVVAMVGS